MEWWYKSEKYPVTEETTPRLRDAVKTTVQSANNLSVVNLYSDKSCFYIKTSNRISLNHFLSQHNFKEIEDAPLDVVLLFGVK